MIQIQWPGHLCEARPRGVRRHLIEGAAATCSPPLSLIRMNITNLIKESIRMGYNDFGDFHYSHGNLGMLFKSYVCTPDYCTTSKHIVHMCMCSILVSIDMGQFTHVASNASKAEQTLEAMLQAMIIFTGTYKISIKLSAYLSFALRRLIVTTILRQHPELKDRPVAVCHSDNPKDTAEILSPTYSAQDYGLFWIEGCDVCQRC